MPTKKPIVKRAPRTLSEKRYAKARISGKNQTQAAIEAYNVTSYGSALRVGHEVEQRLNITQLIEKRERLSDDMLLEDLEKGLESFKIVTSPTEEDKVTPDFSVRHKWWTSAMQLKGHLNTDSGVTQNIQNNIHTDNANFGF